MAVKRELLIQQSFHRGIVTDTARHALPAGAVADAVDMLVHRPGVAFQRGGTEVHSARLEVDATPIAGGVAAVATIHIPTRVVAVDDDGNAWNVTSEGGAQADILDDTCNVPAENPPLLVDRLIFCDSALANAPKTIRWDQGTMEMVVEDLYSNSPPSVRHSLVVNGVVVLARTETNPNRVWWWPDPALEPDVDPLDVFFDLSHEVTGIAACSGATLFFSPAQMTRVLGSVPPGRDGSDMRQQPFATVGCLDARSIVHVNEGVVFANEEAVWTTNGYADPLSLTAAAGFETYWQSLFPSGEARQIAGGLLGYDLYIVSVLEADGTKVDTMLCHLPSRSFVRASGLDARMFAAGRTEAETRELYMASASQPYVYRLSTLLLPDWAHREDADGNEIAGYLDVVFGDAGPLKKLDGGMVTYELLGEAD